MAHVGVKHLYPGSASFEGSLNGNMLVDIPPPEPGETTTAWDVGKTALGNGAEMIFGAAVSSFVTTPIPEGNPNNTDCYVAGPFDGIFYSGSWDFKMGVAASSADGADGQIQFKVWKADNPSGVSASLLTQGILSGSRVGPLTSGVVQQSSLVFSMDDIKMNDEYLLFQIAWWIRAASSKNTADVHIWTGQDYSRITSSLFEFHPSLGVAWLHDEYPAP